MENWGEYLDSLWQEGSDGVSLVCGIDLWEVFRLIHNDYDEVDRFLIDSETIGGG